MTFKDHFSERAELYAVFRPHYPDSLFNFVAGLCDRHDVAVDCGTGNGQAAVEIARYFARVIATDPSEAQIKNASQRANVEYRIARAEQTGIESKSVDLVVAAQALHWFDAKGFFE